MARKYLNLTTWNYRISSVNGFAAIAGENFLMLQFYIIPDF